MVVDGGQVEGDLDLVFQSHVVAVIDPVLGDVSLSLHLGFVLKTINLKKKAAIEKVQADT